MIYIFGNDESKYIRIFMGLFTGSLLGCITATINYLGARKKFFDDIYKNLIQIMIDLYGAKTISKDLAFADNVELDYNKIQNQKAHVDGLYNLAIKISKKDAITEFTGYKPLFGKSKALSVVLTLKQDSYSGALLLEQSTNKFLQNYIQFLIDATPRCVVVEGKSELFNMNSYDYNDYYEKYRDNVQIIQMLIDNIINGLSTLMEELDTLQDITDIRWSNVSKAFNKVAHSNSEETNQ